MSPPSNGGLTYDNDPIGGRYSNGTVISFTCNPGFYRFYGSDHLTCVSTGQWSGTQRRCKRGNEN